jgi:hypothetical protein
VDYPKLPLHALVLSLAILLAPRLPAQVEQASLTGIISDKTGAAVPQARISAENLATGVKTATPSNSSGNFYLKVVPGD